MASLNDNLLFKFSSPSQEIVAPPPLCSTEEGLMAKLYAVDEVESKSKNILSVLTTNPGVLELKVTLYVAACVEGQLNPFPEDLVENSYEGLQCLLLLNNQIPPLSLLRKRLQEKDPVNEHVIALLFWLLYLPGPKYVHVMENFPDILSKVDPSCEAPDYIFKIMVHDMSLNHREWIAAKEELMSRTRPETKFAFYSGGVEHLHSLTSHEVYSFEKTDGPKGFGIYLTESLQSSFEKSPSKWVWGKSEFGVEIQTIVMVEFLSNHEDVVEYTQYEFGPKHYMVSDTSLLQLRYLLIYARTPSKINPSKILPVQETTGGFFTLNRTLFLAGYVITGYLFLTFHSESPKFQGLTGLLDGFRSQFFGQVRQSIMAEPSMSV